jgi:hypothetical protein
VRVLGFLVFVSSLFRMLIHDLVALHSLVGWNPHELGLDLSLYQLMD